MRSPAWDFPAQYLRGNNQQKNRPAPEGFCLYVPLTILAIYSIIAAYYERMGRQNAFRFREQHDDGHDVHGFHAHDDVRPAPLPIRLPNRLTDKKVFSPESQMSFPGISF